MAHRLHFPSVNTVAVIDSRIRACAQEHRDAMVRGDLESADAATELIDTLLEQRHEASS
jgi:hypothetical protein